MTVPAWPRAAPMRTCGVGGGDSAGGRDVAIGGRGPLPAIEAPVAA